MTKFEFVLRLKVINLNLPGIRKSLFFWVPTSEFRSGSCFAPEPSYVRHCQDIHFIIITYLPVITMEKKIDFNTKKFRWYHGGKMVQRNFSNFYFNDFAFEFRETYWFYDDAFFTANMFSGVSTHVQKVSCVVGNRIRSVV